MANLNKVLLIGRLTRDPERRAFQNGGAVTRFGFAVNNRRKNQQTGQWEDEPVFLDCEAFNRGEQGTLADRLNDTVRKGQQIFIEGHLKLDQWEKDGQKQQKLKVVVDNFQYLEPKADNAQSQAPRQQSQPASRPQQQRPAQPPQRQGYNRNYNPPEPDESEVPESPYDWNPGDDSEIPF
jgi:single-strand DNA-binding protein